jgi:hypothetical protein
MTMLINKIEEIIAKVKNGIPVESNKEDIKRIWYDLSSEKGATEFCKDLSAIANTVGPEGLLIIGIDEKTGEIFDSPLRESGILDEAKLFNLVIKKIDPPVDFQLHTISVEGKSISVLTIPPSSRKPHLIREFGFFNKEGVQVRKEDNKIFVKKGTSTYPATKYDLDLMYYDRANAFPDFELDVSLRMKFMIGKRRNEIIDQFRITEVAFSANFIIENTGRRPVYIDDLRFQFENENYQPGQVIFFGFDKSKELIINPKEIRRFQIVLNKNNVREGSLEIFAKPELSYGSNYSGIKNPQIEILLANENKMTFPARILGWIKESAAAVF